MFSALVEGVLNALFGRLARRYAFWVLTGLCLVALGVAAVTGQL